MISASKTTFSLKNLKILRPKNTKNVTNLLKKFCEFLPCYILDCMYTNTISNLSNKLKTILDFLKLNFFYRIESIKLKIFFFFSCSS